ncbi:MAG: RHS repeat-associated core domain-containing protein, partial [Bacilli bacterium]
MPTRTNVALTEESVLILEVNPFLYKGYFYDDYTRLYYCNSRYYDPEIGRWINADDIGYLDLENISGLNLYCYCMNNPIMMSDPEGNLPKWAKLVIGGALVVGAIALTICTAGTTSVAIATALGLKAGTLTAAVVGGAIAGAAVGAVTGAMISAGTQIITNGFDNFSWKEVGLGALNGGIAGGIAGGLFGA